MCTTRIRCMCVSVCMRIYVRRTACITVWMYPDALVICVSVRVLFGVCVCVCVEFEESSARAGYTIIYHLAYTRSHIHKCKYHRNTQIHTPTTEKMRTNVGWMRKKGGSAHNKSHQHTCTINKPKLYTLKHTYKYTCVCVCTRTNDDLYMFNSQLNFFGLFLDFIFLFYYCYYCCCHFFLCQFCLLFTVALLFVVRLFTLLISTAKRGWEKITYNT